MAKKPDLVTVSSGFNSDTAINEDLTALRNAFDNTLSLDGSTPNAMGADLDLNSKDIINIKSVNANTLNLNGQEVVSVNAVFTWKGDWTSSTDFVVDDIVSHEGGSYRCAEDHTSTSDFDADLSSEYWNVLSIPGVFTPTDTISSTTTQNAVLVAETHSSISENDTTPAVLDSKVTVSSPVIKTIDNEGGDESLNISLDSAYAFSYDEGTWTPALGPDVGIVYSTQVGTYTRIGNLVTANFRVVITSKGSPGASSLSISGLPWAAEDNDLVNSATVSSVNGVSGLSAGDILTPVLYGDDDTIAFRIHDAGGNDTGLLIGDITDSFSIAGTITYITDEDVDLPSGVSVFKSAERYVLAETLPTEKVTEASGSVTPSIYDGYNWTSGTEYQITVYAKKEERSKLNIFCNTGLVIEADFDLVKGTAGGTGSSIKALGNGWYRCIVTGTASATATGNLQCRMFDDGGSATYTGDGSSGLYIDNISMVDTSAPTVELLPATSLSSVEWNKQGVTVVGTDLDNLTSEERLEEAYKGLIGEVTADKFVEDSGTISATCYRNLGPTNGLTYTHTVVAKAGERHRMNLFNNGGFSYDCTFDLIRGTASGTGSSITHLGEGWYECTVEKAATSSTSGNCQIRIFPSSGGHPYTGDGTSGFYVNSASLLQGSTELWSDGDAFGGASWTKSGLTIDADAENYRTILLGGQNVVDPGYFQGQKWAALGTSVTAQNQYFAPLETLLGVTGQNLGQSGGSLADGSHYGALYIHDEVPNIDTDTDLVTLEVGTNDFGARNSSLGSLGDTTVSTFYGALYDVVVDIQARAPNALIVFLTPYGSDSRFSTYTALPSNTNADGDTFIDFQNAVREVANMLGMPCIDVGAEGGFGYLTATTWTSDGLHLNAAGGERYADYVKAKLYELGEARQNV